MEKHIVTVTISEGRVSIDKDKVRMKETDEIQWKASGKERFEIEFAAGSPFDSARLSHTRAAAANRPKKVGTFKYTVMDESDNTVRLDPIIIIDPRPSP